MPTFNRAVINELQSSTACILAGSPYKICEPAFGKLELVIHYYNALATTDNEERRVHCISQLIFILVSDKVKIQRISTAELIAFLELIPKACGLEQPQAKSDTSKDKGLDFIYGHLAACFGWTFDNIAQTMTMTRLKRLTPYLESHPATHIIAAAALGFEKKDQDTLHKTLHAIADKARSLRKWQVKPKLN